MLILLTKTKLLIICSNSKSCCISTYFVIILSCLSSCDIWACNQWMSSCWILCSVLLRSSFIISILIVNFVLSTYNSLGLRSRKLTTHVLWVSNRSKTFISFFTMIWNFHLLLNLNKRALRSIKLI
jgi:hypothetical protein